MLICLALSAGASTCSAATAKHTPRPSPVTQPWGGRPLSISLDASPCTHLTPRAVSPSSTHSRSSFRSARSPPQRRPRMRARGWRTRSAAGRRVQHERDQRKWPRQRELAKRDHDHQRPHRCQRDQYAIKQRVLFGHDDHEQFRSVGLLHQTSRTAPSREPQRERPATPVPEGSPVIIRRLPDAARRSMHAHFQSRSTLSFLPLQGRSVFVDIVR